MIHIATKYDEAAKVKVKKRSARSTSVILDANVLPPEATLCGAQMTPDDSLTSTALASDCDTCRVKAGVGRVNDKQWSGETIGVHPVPSYEPQPMADAEELIESARKNRG